MRHGRRRRSAYAMRSQPGATATLALSAGSGSEMLEFMAGHCMPVRTKRSMTRTALCRLGCLGSQSSLRGTRGAKHRPSMARNEVPPLEDARVRPHTWLEWHPRQFVDANRAGRPLRPADRPPCGVEDERVRLAALATTTPADRRRAVARCAGRVSACATAG